ncbi:IS4 family transposase [Paraburkholderia heleia]|uniref:IS4 family transposase n=1 Tax=Paraburkholderia heleia TaxID=634127 RepID=UPI0038B6F062
MFCRNLCCESAEVCRKCSFSLPLTTHNFWSLTGGASHEIHGARMFSKKPRPKKTPTLNQMIRMIRMIASLGGVLGRRSDGEPGAKTLWIGMQWVMDAVITIQILRDGYDTSV